MSTQEQDVSPQVARLIDDLRAALTEMQERACGRKKRAEEVDNAAEWGK